MHDTLSQICRIRIPIPFMGKARKSYRGGWIELADIWHKDPCKNGSDDSCGRFMRARHGDPAALKKIEADILFDWKYQFNETGDPLHSTSGILLNWYLHAAHEVFKGDRRKTWRWMQKHLFEILLFAENPIDSAHDQIQGRYGEDRAKPESRAHRAAAMVYADVLRKTRPWWKSPNLHVHHWRIVFPWWINLRRLLWDRCCKCRKTLGWNKCVVSDWSGQNQTCHRCSAAQVAPR